MKRFLLTVFIICLTGSVLCNEYENITNYLNSLKPNDTIQEKVEYRVHRKDWTETFRFYLMADTRDNILIELTFPENDAGKMFFQSEGDIYIFDRQNFTRLSDNQADQGFLGGDLTYAEQLSLNNIAKDPNIRFEKTDNTTKYKLFMEHNGPKGNVIRRVEWILEKKEDSDEFLLQTMIFYDSKDRPTKRIDYSDYREIKGIKYPFYQKVTNLKIKHYYTEIITEELNIGIAFPSSKFDLNMLQKRLESGRRF